MTWPPRELTPAECYAIYAEDRCPFCSSKDFYEGPHGGAAINIYCANESCMAGFNLNWPVVPYGQLIREPGSPMPAEDRVILKRPITLTDLRASGWS